MGRFWGINLDKRNYWNRLNKKYSECWTSELKKRISKKELGFINKYIIRTENKNVLDVGVGTGRIIENYIDNISKNTKIYGVDFSDEMINICKKRFGKRITKLFRGDISTTKIPARVKFDFITAIRVISYSKNWNEILRKLHEQMNDDGILVFTMPNRYSVNSFYITHKIEIYRSDPASLERAVKSSGYELLEMKSFSRLPDVMYDLTNNAEYVATINFTEEILQRILGNTLLGRVLFVAVKKKER